MGRNRDVGWMNGESAILFPGFWAIAQKPLFWLDGFPLLTNGVDRVTSLVEELP